MYFVQKYYPFKRGPLTWFLGISQNFFSSLSATFCETRKGTFVHYPLLYVYCLPLLILHFW